MVSAAFCFFPACLRADKNTNAAALTLPAGAEAFVPKGARVIQVQAASLRGPGSRNYLVCYQPAPKETPSVFMYQQVTVVDVLDERQGKISLLLRREMDGSHDVSVHQLDPRDPVPLLFVQNAFGASVGANLLVYRWNGKALELLPPTPLHNIDSLEVRDILGDGGQEIVLRVRYEKDRFLLERNGALIEAPENYALKFAAEEESRNQKDVIAPLLAQWKSPDPKERLAALRGLCWNRYVDSSTLFPVVLEALKDPDGDVRWLALGSLDRFQDQSDKVIPILVDAIHHSRDPRLRKMAVLRLGGLGDKAGACVPLILKLRYDPDVDFEETDGPDGKIAEKRFSYAVCYGALKKIGPAAFPELLGILRAGDFKNEEMLFLTLCLGSYGPAAKDALPVLTSLLPEYSNNYQQERGIEEAIDEINGVSGPKFDSLGSPGGFWLPPKK